MLLPTMIVAVGLVIMGLVALAKPIAIVGFFDGTAETVNARNEIRAVYGGFGVCLGMLVLLASFLIPHHAVGIYIAVGVALAGMALGRVISAIIEVPSFWPWFFFGVETIAALMMFSVVIDSI